LHAVSLSATPASIWRWKSSEFLFMDCHNVREDSMILLQMRQVIIFI
jgi:hypothetical protein